jgi:NAD(P)-dependent dehydrogenase (short-subunit alcohol dehydrogenase family)
MDLKGIENRVAIVTGSARGLGRATAMRFALEGAHVIVCDVKADEVHEVSDAIESMGKRSLWFEVDVSDICQVKRMVDETVATFGRIDILVNNAGITDQMVPTVDQDFYKWKRCFDVHMSGTYICSKEVGSIMVNNKYGRIVNLSSIVGLRGFPNRTAYGPAKAAIVNLTKVLATEWATFNVNVNAVAPGSIWTPMVEEKVNEGKLNIEGIKSRIPMGHLGQVEDVVNAVHFLCSDAAAYITGVTLAVDGGYMAYGGF